MSNNELMGKSEKQPLLQDEESEIGIDQPQESGWKEKLRSFGRSMLKKEMLTVLIYSVCYVISGVINSILLKLTMNSFQNYGFFLNQLTNYGFIPIFGAVVAYKIMFTNDIPQETRDFPKYKFLIMGALDAVTGYFVVIGGISTSGPLQQLLNQAIIPFTMLSSLVFLKMRYSWIQVTGALVIIAGVVVSLIPSLTGKSDANNKVFWNLFYLISMIPFALSNIYKDIGFQSVQDMDVWYLQFYDSLFQGIVGTFLFPINNWLPPPGGIKFKDIIPSLRDGAECLAGTNTITMASSNNTCDLPTTDFPCDNCHNAYIIIIIYMTINIVYNVFILLVIKHAGATVYSIANTLRLPLTNIVFSLKFIVPVSIYQAFSGLSVAGLIIILLGLVGYRIGSMIKAKQSGEDGEVKVIPGLGPAGVEVLPAGPLRRPLIEPKSPEHLRNQFFARGRHAVNE
ncbi:putative transmembrane protein [Heterostelium album PN500]|uniref:Putative transmembrane protein n=1 Tax=Heterostelium pallidum (strain ATCC 26659 / Pp 5 / PN500) TaxID=670386 RepID=D3B5S8_HETP5|nr:putative transmembrane protein [Heterostelium album PN500]EFA83226.1 putative transmembrane protein [Heterostelium album PN500]|eukprot:XP_020435343.1 putative transmembrane protein [Heterostelium album PN500]